MMHCSIKASVCNFMSHKARDANFPQLRSSLRFARMPSAASVSSLDWRGEPMLTWPGVVVVYSDHHTDIDSPNIRHSFSGLK